MKEKPILFGGPMVRAILEGRKSQTRRLVKYVAERGGAIAFDGKTLTYAETNPYTGEHVKRHAMGCPYGKPGDRLWVRETWAVEESLNDTPPSKFSKWPTWFAADGSYLANTPKRGVHTGKPRGRWRPSIHMPRWASRITLEITDVRVERVKEISGQDAISEGIEPFSRDGITTFRDYLTGETGHAAYQSFQTLWQSINGLDSWDANPWVWVVEFQKLEI